MKLEISHANQTAKKPPFPGMTENEDQQVEAVAQSEWNRNPAVRAEFNNNFQTYAAYRKAEACGVVKICGGHGVVK